MALIFPSNPALNDEFAGGGTIWRWNGTAWDRVAFGSVEITNGADSPVPVVGKPAGMVAKGYQQLTSLAGPTALTVPSGATVAFMVVEGQGIRWRDDGVDPTASVGTPLAAGDSIPFSGSLSAFRVIEQMASAKLNVNYYG